MKFAFVFLCLVFGAGFAQAKGGACCACQTGSFPDNQVPFFSAGCKLWLAGQKNCDQSMTIPEDQGLSALPESCDGKLVKLGFVGHWMSSSQSASFIENLFQDGVIKRQMSFQVDNTACRGMDNTEYLEDRLSSLKFPDNKYVVFRANQVVSVGMCDDLMVGHSNLWAQYDSRTKHTTFPRCVEFEGKGCTDLGGIQKGETGLCRESIGQLKELVCCPLEVKVTKLSAKKGSEPQEATAVTTFWATRETCNRGKF